MRRYTSGLVDRWSRSTVQALSYTGLTASKKIEYAGYQRYILSRNPKRYDDYGDELEDDEIDEKADAEAAEENPYNEIKLEGTPL